VGFGTACLLHFVDNQDHKLRVLPLAISQRAPSPSAQNLKPALSKPTPKAAF
jgi:hypothetical protein